MGETEELGDSLTQTLLLTTPERPTLCCGLDEVGRGALAGPLVAAGVVLPDDIVVRLGPLARFLRDSKTVPRHHREALAKEIRIHALAVEVVLISAPEINAHGIGWANREAFYRLICAITADEYIVDGRVRPPSPPERTHLVHCMVKADAKVPAVAAASLVAKVYRDAWMIDLHKTYPAFAWARNVGYGTAGHLAALQAEGPCPEHRTQFVRTALNGGQRARKKHMQSEPLLIQE